MSCCRRPSSQQSPVPPIIDVDKVLKDYVWTCFTESVPWYQRLFLRRSNCYVDVPMSYLHFENLPREQKVKHRTRSHPQQEKLTNKERVEIATDFVNNTDTSQTYRFRLEKTRQTKLNVTIQRGFTVGNKFRIIVGLPKILSGSKVEAETDMRINVSRTDAEAIEETVVLETTSDISVDKRCKYVARVEMSETPVNCDFTVVNRMTMPGGGANVAVVRKTGRKIVYSSVIYTPALETIFKDFLKSKAVKIVPIGRVDGIDRFAADITSQGVIEGVRVSDQSIILDSYQLPKSLKDEDKTTEKSSLTPCDVSATSVITPSTTVTTSSAVKRPHSINGTIPEESNEEDEAEEALDSGSSSRHHSSNESAILRTQSPSAHLSVRSSPNSLASSPMSERAGSVGSDVGKTMTTV